MSNVQTIIQTAQPDIQYHPDFVKYQDRTRHRKETESLQTTLPAGFPAQLISPLVWEGKEVENRSDWIYMLNDAQLDEIDAALKSFKGLLGNSTPNFRANKRSPESTVGIYQPVYVSLADATFNSPKSFK